jgi:hypothetical protein
VAGLVDQVAEFCGDLAVPLARRMGGNLQRHGTKVLFIASRVAAKQSL